MRKTQKSTGRYPTNSQGDVRSIFIRKRELIIMQVRTYLLLGNFVAKEEFEKTRMGGLGVIRHAITTDQDAPVIIADPDTGEPLPDPFEVILPIDKQQVLFRVYNHTNMRDKDAFTSFLGTQMADVINTNHLT